MRRPSRWAERVAHLYGDAQLGADDEEGLSFNRRMPH